MCPDPWERLWTKLLALRDEQLLEDLLHLYLFSLEAEHGNAPKTEQPTRRRAKLQPQQQQNAPSEHDGDEGRLETLNDGLLPANPSTTDGPERGRPSLATIRPVKPCLTMRQMHRLSHRSSNAVGSEMSARGFAMGGEHIPNADIRR